MRRTRSRCCARAASGHAPPYRQQRDELAPPHVRPWLRDGIVSAQQYIHKGWRPRCPLGVKSRHGASLGPQIYIALPQNLRLRVIGLYDLSASAAGTTGQVQLP